MQRNHLYAETKEPATSATNTTVFCLLLAVIIGTPFSALYALGYRISGTGTLERPVELIVTNLEPGVRIFLNKEDKGTIGTESTEKFEHLAAGTYDVLIAKDGYWPWSKQVILPGGTVATATPFFVPMNSSGYIITKADPEFTKILAAFAKARIPTEATPKISQNGATKIWVGAGTSGATGATLYATAHGTTTKVFEGKSTITAVDFYKDRDDVAIIAIEDGIYAIELNPNLGQNFQPIYKGTKPTFVPKDTNSLYVLDAKSYMQIGY